MSLPLNAQDLQEQLYAAAAAGDCTAIRALALHGADLDARNKDGFTAFNLATKNNHPQAAMTILAAREFNYLKKLDSEAAGAPQAAGNGGTRVSRAA